MNVSSLAEGRATKKKAPADRKKMGWKI